MCLVPCLRFAHRFSCLVCAHPPGDEEEAKTVLQEFLPLVSAQWVLPEECASFQKFNGMSCNRLPKCLLTGLEVGWGWRNSFGLIS